MERRGFLRLLGLGVAGVVLDPERLLWVPGQRRIFDLGDVPLAQGNTFLTIEIITREALRVLEHNLLVAGRVNREFADRWFDPGPMGIHVAGRTNWRGSR